MKTRGIIILTAFTCLLAGFLVYKIITKNASNQEIAISKQTLPPFSFYSQDLKAFNSTSVDKDKSICIFYYNAECDHCQYEAKQLRLNIDAFKEAQILMVSTNKPSETQKFAIDYQLTGYPFIIWVYDKDFNFYKWFGNAVAPSVYIYNNKQHLVKQYSGEVKIEAILRSLNND